MSAQSRRGARDAHGRRIGARRATAGAVALALVIAAQSGTATLATWTDDEWVAAPASGIGTLDCVDPSGAFASRGEGRVLSGSLLGLDSAGLADITGTRVTNDGTRTLVRPVSAAPVLGHDDAFADPLRLDLLDDAVALDATGLLQLPLSTDLGLLGQFGQARSSGDSAGAAGYLTDAGTINTDGELAGYPHFATLRLSALLDTLGYDLGTIVGDTALDVSLDIGAVAGRAEFVDACAAFWAADPASALHRDYLAAGLSTRIASPTVSALGPGVNSTVTGLQNGANALLGQQGLLNGVATQVVNLVTNALGLVTSLAGLRVKPDGTTATLTGIDLDLGPVQQLIDAPIEDPDGVLSVSLTQGTVTIDTAALLAEAYPGSIGDGLNGLPPNSNPLDDPVVAAALTAKLSSLLSGWLATVDARLTAALDGAVVTATVSIPVQRCSFLSLLVCLGTWQDAGAIGVHLTGTLAELLAGDVVPTLDTSALNLGLIGSLLGGLVSAVLGALTGTLGVLVGTVVDDALRPLAALPASTMSTLGTPIVALVTDVYRELFLEGAAAITVNAQNDPPTGSAEPHDWAALTSGRYDVAAMRIGLLDAAGASAAWLYLGRGSVGANCAVSQASPLCAGY